MGSQFQVGLIGVAELHQPLGLPEALRQTSGDWPHLIAEGQDESPAGRQAGGIVRQGLTPGEQGFIHAVFGRQCAGPPLQRSALRQIEQADAHHGEKFFRAGPPDRT